MSFDLMQQIRGSMETEALVVLGSSYQKLAYLENIQKNSFRTGNDRYGVRALDALQNPGVTKQVTLTQTFELILTKGYVESAVSDNNQVSKSYELRALMLEIYKHFINTKAGLPGIVLNVNNLNVASPEYLEDDKLVIQRATMEVIFRYSLI